MTQSLLMQEGWVSISFTYRCADSMTVHHITNSMTCKAFPRHVAAGLCLGSDQAIFMFLVLFMKSKMGVQVVLSLLVGGWETSASLLCLPCSNLIEHLISSSKWRDTHTPPPVQWCSESQNCPLVVVHCTICLQSKSQMRLDEVLHTEIILVWHPVAALFWRWGDFLDKGGWHLSEGQVYCWLVQISVWMETDSARHLLCDSNNLSVCLRDLQDLKSVWREI